MFLPDIYKEEFIVADCETYDPGLTEYGTNAIHRAKGGELLGWSVCTPSGFNQWYDYEGPEAPSSRWVVDQLNKTPQYVNANTKYDILWFMGEKLLKKTDPLFKKRVGDILINAVLLNNTNLYPSVDSLAELYKLPEKKKDILIEAGRDIGIKPADIMGNLHRLPRPIVAEYGNYDTRLTCDIWQIQKPLMIAERLQNVQKLEEFLLPIIAIMESIGIRYDVDQVPALIETLDQKIIEMEAQVLDMTGLNLGHTVTDKLRNWLDDNISDMPRTAGGKVKADEKTLDSFEGVHEVLDLIIKVRKVGKARGTDVIGRFQDHGHNGRIYPNFNQIGAKTGRPSSTKPNVLNVPNPSRKTDPFEKWMAEQLRSQFVAENGCKFMSSDYSQQEPRQAVHYAVKWGLPGAQEVADSFWADPNQDWHGKMADSGGIERDPAKILVLGRMYLGGFDGLFAQVKHTGISFADLESAVKKLDKEMPWLKMAGDAAKGQAANHGYVKTELGRISRFVKWEPDVWFGRNAEGIKKRKEWETKFGSSKKNTEEYALENWTKKGIRIKRADTKDGFNAIVQGSSADQTKRSIVDAWHKHDLLPILFPYDEVCDASIKGSEDTEAWKECMLNAVKLAVPCKVDMKVSNCWQK